MFRKEALEGFLRPLVRPLAARGVSPDWLTVVGVVLTLPVPVLLHRGNFALAGCWLLIAGAFDTLDGALARLQGRKRPFGAFLDSTMDRVSEAMVFAGFILFYSRHLQPAETLLAFGTFALSQWVPYARARAEGLGLECRVGVLPRPGRVILLALGLWLGRPTETLALIALLSAWTVVQRILLVRRLAR